MLYYSQNRDKNRMSRVPAFFMAALLLFSGMPVSLAQQSAVRAEAEADANSDMPKVRWFMLGAVSSTAGCILGCVGGGFVGRILDPGSAPDFFIYSPVTSQGQASCLLAGAFLLGVLAVPAAVFDYPHNPNPLPERLLGKSAEYVEAYTQAYRAKTISLRKRLVTAGSITSNLGFLALILNSI